MKAISKIGLNFFCNMLLSLEKPARSLIMKGIIFYKSKAFRASTSEENLTQK
jgi:hypothetical protein